MRKLRKPTNEPTDRGLARNTATSAATNACAFAISVKVSVTAPRVFLCLHGQPTWSYLYRRMIPVFTAAGHRVVAPDLLGFGRSDKPADDARYTFMFHRDMLKNLVEHLDLRDVVLTVQDWGGLLGLTLPMETPERYAGLFIMNTAFGTGDAPLPPSFLEWRAYNNSQPDLAVGRLLARACPHLTPTEAAAYDAPFPDASFQGRRAALSQSRSGQPRCRGRGAVTPRARLVPHRPPADLHDRMAARCGRIAHSKRGRQ